MRTKVEYKDFEQFKFLSGITYSPDGKHAAFVKHDVDMEGNKYLSNLYVLDVETKEIKKLTATNTERSFWWETNDTILFPSQRGENKKGSTNIYHINLNGGEAQLAYTIPYTVTKIDFLPDGKLLLGINKKLEEIKDPENRAQLGKDYIVFDELPHWFNGRGVINRTRSAVVIYDPATKEGKQITPEYMNANSVGLSSCKKYVVFVGNEYKDVSGGAGSLNLYSIEKDELKVLVPQADENIGGAYWMEKGVIFFTANKKNEKGVWHNPTCYEFDCKTMERREVGFFDHTIGGAVSNDASYGGGNAMVQFVDGKLYFLRVNRVDSELCVMENDQPKVLSKVPGGINAITIHGGKCLMIAHRGMKLNEIYEMDLATGEETQISTVNEEFYNTKTISPVEYTTFTTDYGVDLDCFVIKPAGYKAGHKYPCVLSMHGGPKVVFGGIYHHEMQAQANDGYFVIYTNPRGADGRGDDFANALIGDMGGPDYQDLMAFVDHCIEAYPDIDADKIAICGGSYAGFMINWMIGHTNRFAAAAPQRSISNYMSKGLTTDIGFNHNMTQLMADPWTNWEKMWAQSPLKYAFNATTPTLFIQSDEDYRCWMSEPIQMFNVLKRKGVPTKMCLFHGENHELSRSGKPQNRLSRLEEIAAWFNKYCK